jgi:hypothetical protein
MGDNRDFGAGCFAGFARARVAGRFAAALVRAFESRPPPDFFFMGFPRL